MNEKRIKQFKSADKNNGAVVYWMQRDQRVNDNWALIFAQQKAAENNAPLVVVFNLVNDFLGAGKRHFGFMLKGLEEVERKLSELNIPFRLLTGDPEKTLPDFLKSIDACTLITDFSPLKISRIWKKKVLESSDVSFYTVDAHNIIPAWITSEKEEFAAYTIRPKIHRLLPEYLEEFPLINMQTNNPFGIVKTDWPEIYNNAKINITDSEYDWITPGADAAVIALNIFLKEKLRNYSSDRNDPTKQGTSNISPFLHFGHISAQRIALECMQSEDANESRDAFLEELIVRRELSDNYCLYNNNYDNFNGLKDWAKDSLNKHRRDKRDYVYKKDEFENCSTHDPLWNAAQNEMKKSGKMHGYMRMYWAKKILEWSVSPEDAIETAIYLNDKYELDGRDPNGYVGVLWSIGGLHDRAWAERPVFGKIRYMNFNGCKRKFDVNKYIEMWR